MCGNSILRATRTYPVRQDRQERNILVRHVSLHLISRLERVCAACWRSATRELQRRDQQDSNHPGLSEAILPDVGSSSDLNIPEPPPLPQQNLHTTHIRSNPTIRSSVYKYSASTSNHCIFVNCFESECLLVPSSIKDLLLLNNKFYVPPAARICRHHLDHGRWSELTSQLKDFTGNQFDSIMRIVQLAAYYHIDFSNILIMPTFLCHFWLGMNSDQFYDLLNCIPSLAGQVPNATVALSIYLVKLRTDDSNERLATLFNKSRVTLERLMNKARTCLINEFVPLYLGFNHMNVEDVASRNRIIPEGLFDNPDLLPNSKPAIIICDATYVFIQSSSNYLFQKQTYSLQKLDNLVKPFMIVCCDGHIVDCLGPFKATTNDATITSLNLRNEEAFLRSCRLSVLRIWYQIKMYYFGSALVICGYNYDEGLPR